MSFGFNEIKENRKMYFYTGVADINGKTQGVFISKKKDANGDKVNEYSNYIEGYLTDISRDEYNGYEQYIFVFSDGDLDMQIQCFRNSQFAIDTVKGLSVIRNFSVKVKLNIWAKPRTNDPTKFDARCSVYQSGVKMHNNTQIPSGEQDENGKWNFAKRDKAISDMVDEIVNDVKMAQPELLSKQADEKYNEKKDNVNLNEMFKDIGTFKEEPVPADEIDCPF